MKTLAFLFWSVCASSLIYAGGSEEIVSRPHKKKPPRQAQQTQGRSCSTYELGAVPGESAQGERPRAHTVLSLNRQRIDRDAIVQDSELPSPRENGVDLDAIWAQTASDQEARRVIEAIPVAVEEKKLEEPEEESAPLGSGTIQQAHWERMQRSLWQMARGEMPVNAALIAQVRAFAEARGWHQWEGVDGAVLDAMDARWNQWPNIGLFVTNAQGQSLLAAAAQPISQNAKHRKNLKKIQSNLIHALLGLEMGDQSRLINAGVANFFRHTQPEEAIDALKGAINRKFHGLKYKDENHGIGGGLYRAAVAGEFGALLAYYSHLNHLGIADFDDVLSYIPKGEQEGLMDRVARLARQDPGAYDSILSLLQAMEGGKPFALDPHEGFIKVTRTYARVPEEEDFTIPEPIAPTLGASQDSVELRDELPGVIWGLAQNPEALWVDPGEELDWEAFVAQMDAFADGRQGLSPEAAAWLLRMQKHFLMHRGQLPAFVQLFLQGEDAGRMIYEWPLNEDGDSLLGVLLPGYGQMDYRSPIVDAQWARLLGIRRMLECPDQGTQLLGLKLINLIQAMGHAATPEDRFAVLKKFDDAHAEQGGLGVILVHVLDWGSHAADPLYQADTADTLISTIIWQALHTPSELVQYKKVKVKWILEALKAAAKGDSDDLARVHAMLPAGWEAFDPELLNARLDGALPGDSMAHLVAKKFLKVISDQQREQLLRAHAVAQNMAPVVEQVVGHALNDGYADRVFTWFCPGFGWVLSPVKWAWNWWSGQKPKEPLPQDYGLGGIAVVSKK